MIYDLINLYCNIVLIQEEIEEPRRKKKKKRRDTKLAKSPIQMKLSDIHIEDADPDEVTYCSCNQVNVFLVTYQPSVF